MERPQSNIEQPTDEYDHELTATQANVIALADELLKSKSEKSRVTFVDFILEGDGANMVNEIVSGPLANILSSSDKQLAFESDGSYYPVLDVRKENATLTGVGLRVYGWEDEKIRYTNPDQTSPPYDYKTYPDETDKRREITISMGYKAGDQTFNESLSLYASTSHPDYFYLSSKIYMHAYMETGYEGHGGHSDNNPSNESVEWMLDFVARHVGDQPKSRQQHTVETLYMVRIKAEEVGAGEAVDKLIKTTWPEQALYMLNKPCTMLDGKSIIEGFLSPDTADDAAKAIKKLRKQWKKRSRGEEVDWII